MARMIDRSIEGLGAGGSSCFLSSFARFFVLRRLRLPSSRVGSNGYSSSGHQAPNLSRLTPRVRSTTYSRRCLSTLFFSLKMIALVGRRYQQTHASR